MSKLAKRRAQLKEAQAKAKTILGKYGEDDTMSAEDRDGLKELNAEMDGLKAEIATLEALEAAERSEEAVEDPSQVAAQAAGHSPARVGEDPKTQINSFGEFLQCVAAAGAAKENKAIPGVDADVALKKLEVYEKQQAAEAAGAGASAIQAAASGMSATTPSEGGFLVRTDFRTDLMMRSQEQSMLYQRCTRIPIGADADGLEAPFIDETSRATGSRWGGVQVYRKNEADTVSATNPTLGLFELRLEDLMGLAYATQRSLRDASSLGAILQMAFSSEMAFKIDDEIVNGTGAGQCQGILNAAGRVAVDKETNQTAATVVAENVIKMRNRMPVNRRQNAVWLINADVEDVLPTMSISVGTGGVPVYMPAGGLSESPFDRLFTRPVIPIEQAAAIGTEGDIMFVDLTDYIIAEKGGISFADSMHVRFLYNEMTFRWTWSVNGRPFTRSALSPYKGSVSKSPYVTLATRA